MISDFYPVIPFTNYIKFNTVGLIFADGEVLRFACKKMWSKNITVFRGAVSPKAATFTDVINTVFSRFPTFKPCTRRKSKVESLTSIPLM